jgi:siroheme synthase-like protein
VPLSYPIFLDLSQRQIVIVGGGAVASRKATGLLTAGASRVRAIAPKFVREFPQKIERISENFSPAHLDGAGLVFAATDSPHVNQQVVAEAQRRGVLVNRADPDEDDPADFVTPALLRCGAITVAISAAGSPALAAVIRDRLAESLTDDWVKLADVMVRLRPRIKSLGLPMARRRDIFRALAGAEAASTLELSGEAGLWDWAAGKFPELGSPPAGETA